MTIPESDWPEWAKYLTLDWRGFVFHEHAPRVSEDMERPMYWSEGIQQRVCNFIGPVITRGKK